MMDGFQMGLGGLPLISDAESRSISAENPTGERGGGARAPSPQSPHPAQRLGEGWKVRPYVTLPPGETVVLADIEGPGIINHIWITLAQTGYRDCVLRFFLDVVVTA